jgi:hypothetical protein
VALEVARKSIILTHGTGTCAISAEEEADESEESEYSAEAVDGEGAAARKRSVDLLPTTGSISIPKSERDSGGRVLKDCDCDCIASARLCTCSRTRPSPQEGSINTNLRTNPIEEGVRNMRWKERSAMNATLKENKRKEN